MDDLTHDDIKAYAAEHYPSQEPSRIEWIDDTSANLIYPTEETAFEALQSFTPPQALSADLSQLQPAKPLSSKPHNTLHVRQANTHDVKKRRAHESSRFYLFNPEYDHRERRRQYEGRRGQGRDGRGWKRRRSDPESMQKQKQTPFNESMYDDPPASDTPLATFSENERRSKRPRFGGSRDDLFAYRSRGPGVRLRDRSASPDRLSNGDGRYGFDDSISDHPISTAFNRRNPNAGKELLSAPAANARSFLRESSPAPKELFPTQSSPVRDHNAGKELFGNAPGTPYHRRTDAFDAADEAEYNMEASPTRTKSRSLEERITGGPALRGKSPDKRTNGSNHPSNPGFTIKGAAKEANARVKELFPDKVGDNSGKELFAGRRNPRQRAEDLFG